MTVEGGRVIRLNLEDTEKEKEKKNAVSNGGNEPGGFHAKSSTFRGTVLVAFLHYNGRIATAGRLVLLECFGEELQRRLAFP